MRTHEAMQKPAVVAGWNGFDAAIGEVAEAKVRAHLLTLHLALRVQLGDPAAVPILAAAPLTVRLDALRLAMAPGASPEVREVARAAVAEIGPQATLQDRALAVWAGAPIDVLRELPMLDRMRGLARVVATGFLESVEALEAWLPGLETTEADVVLVQWFGTTAFGGTAREARLIEAISVPMTRLEAMALAAARHPIDPELARVWADAAADLVRTPGAKAPRVIAQARWAGLAARAGLATADAGYKAALTEAGRAPDPIMRSATYRALFGAVCAGFEIGHWEKLCDVVSMDPAFLPQPHHFTVTRAAAARLLPRWAARDGTVSALDRAYTSYRAMTRRTREPWLDALGHALAARLMVAEGRSAAVPLAAIADLVRAGLPAPVPEVTLQEIMVQLGPTAPGWCVETAELVRDPLRRALWLGTALPFLG